MKSETVGEFVAPFQNRAPQARESRDSQFERIVGSSAALETVLEQVERVGPTDSTVLIEGETGTGKELIAQAVHDVSPRRNRRFVKVNCAAIPHDLLESELFGHEKGAFTGAIGQKVGRFELAHQGTIFLDEIGDIPLASQPKLLRILQEQEFERLGSGQTLKVNVRVIAATHRNLTEMAARNGFRSDLYYRLNVFPIQVPPLRERRKDIPEIVAHFVRVFSRRIGKQIEEIPPGTMTALVSYPWPGNIRELQNLIERAVILANDTVLPNPLPLFSPDTINWCGGRKTLLDVERGYILRVLNERGWIIGGANGAAAKLGLKRTTLLAKMKKLGIDRPVRHMSEMSDYDPSTIAPTRELPSLT